MGFILLFGTGFFGDMMCIGNVGQTNKIVKNLEEIVDKVQALDEGSSTTFKMTLPSNGMVCFIDPTDPRPSITGNWLPDPELYPVIETRIKTGGYNVWIEYNCGNTNPGYIMKYIVTPEPGQRGNFCVASGDTLMLTNTGVEVRLERFAG